MTFDELMTRQGEIDTLKQIEAASKLLHEKENELSKLK